MWLDICGVFARMNEHKLHNLGSIPTIKLSTYRPRLNIGKEILRYDWNFNLKRVLSTDLRKPERAQSKSSVFDGIMWLTAS
ncbi:hypothetical protein TSUD_130980 [Trifolium subterraneum]|nr:hypothetical protein TSUD_130980 [Trifolium subterraneum]